MKKIVAVFASIDGGGGAGLLADCRAVASAGCRPLAVVLGVSAQNLDNFAGLWQVPPGVVGAQFSALSGAPVAAVKIGMLADNAAAVGRCIKQIRQTHPAPVVWDPVVAATAPLAGAAKQQKPNAIQNARRHIARHVFVATPNRAELSALTGGKTISEGLRVLFADGVRYVLITGIAAGKGKLRHCLYSADSDVCAPIWDVVCERRRGVFHGSGCLFSSLLAAHLARGECLTQAAGRANAKTLAAIDKAQNTKPDITGWGRRQKILPQ
ncbi:MAG: bifunctional hydroxymethylpyrimidine kinase/phosphomethylpyrimidine kinase [Gammaproteobacteria bacterium]